MPGLHQEPLDEVIREHQRLLRVLRSPSHADDRNAMLILGVTSRARPWFRPRGEAEWMGVGSGCSHRGAPFRFGCDG